MKVTLLFGSANSRTYHGKIFFSIVCSILGGYRKSWNVIQNYSIYCSIRPTLRLALVEVTYRTAAPLQRTAFTMDLYRLILVGSESALIYSTG